MGKWFESIFMIDHLCQCQMFRITEFRSICMVTHTIKSMLRRWRFFSNYELHFTGSASK